MPKAAAIDVGSHNLRVVELEGTAKKAKLTHYGIEWVPPAAKEDDPEVAADAVSAAVASVLKDEGVPKTNLTMSVPVRDSVMRKLHVPFKGRENVRKVLKAEMESLVHSHAIDEMVADHQPLFEDDGGTMVLAAAVPKPPLKIQLDAADRAGLEVEVLAHEAMGLYEAARWCGAFDDADEEVDDDAVVVTDDESAPPSASAAVPARVGGADFRVVVQVAGDETVLLLVKDGKLHDIRGLRAGDESLVEEIATAYGLDPGTARWASLEALATGEEVVVDGLAGPAVPADPEEATESEVPVAVAESVTVAPALVQRAADRYMASIRRELVRFLASVPELTSVRAVTVTGPALDWPGMQELLGEIFGVVPTELDILEHLQHSVPEEDLVKVRRMVPVSVGLALGRIRGANLLQFRQEDLAFTRGFDRIKFPLALVCMLGLFALLLHGMKQQKELQSLEQQLGSTYFYEITSGSERGQQGVQFTGYLNTLFPIRRSRSGSIDERGWFSDDRNFPKDDYKKLKQELAEMEVHKRISHVRKTLKDYLEDSQEEKSFYSDLQMESGFAVLTRLTELWRSVEGQLDRPRLGEISLDLPSKSGKTGGTLKFMVVVRGKNFRDEGQVIQQALERDMTKPDSPFLELNMDRLREEPFSDGEGGARLTYEIKLRPDFAPFPN